MRQNERPVQLLLDMKVRWGSTYVMLNRAETKRDVSQPNSRIIYYSAYIFF
jgi:hypothetical protein